MLVSCKSVVSIPFFAHDQLIAVTPPIYHSNIHYSSIIRLLNLISYYYSYSYHSFVAWVRSFIILIIRCDGDRCMQCMRCMHAMRWCDAINMIHTTQAILSSSSIIVYRDKLPISIRKIAVNFTYDDELR